MSDMLKFPQDNPDFNVALSMSVVLFGFDGDQLQLLLARSQRDPVQGCAVPARAATSKPPMN